MKNLEWSKENRTATSLELLLNNYNILDLIETCLIILIIEGEFPPNSLLKYSLKKIVVISVLLLNYICLFSHFCFSLLPKFICQ